MLVISDDPLWLKEMLKVPDRNLSPSRFYAYSTYTHLLVFSDSQLFVLLNSGGHLNAFS
jgi:hypothetical protein